MIYMHIGNIYHLDRGDIYYIYLFIHLFIYDFF